MLDVISFCFLHDCILLYLHLNVQTSLSLHCGDKFISLPSLSLEDYSFQIYYDIFLIFVQFLLHCCDFHLHLGNKITTST